jgi:hypothetical protein
MELQASFVARQQFLTLVTLARDLAYIFKLSLSSSLSSLQPFECLLQNSQSISADNGNSLSSLFGMPIHYLRCQTIPSMF